MKMLNCNQMLITEKKVKSKKLQGKSFSETLSTRRVIVRQQWMKDTQNERVYEAVSE